MNGKFFLDTNIFVYSFDRSNSMKRARAIDLITTALTSGKGTISYQVVQEFINVSTRKFQTPLSWDSVREYYKLVLEPLAQVLPTSELYGLAMDTSERWKYGFYDSLILASALSSGCKTLYSEDLQHGQKIQGLTVMNPFL